MITLHILKLLEQEGFGTIDTDLFWEEIPIDSTGKDKNGMWIISRGAPLSRGTRTVEAFDIYARYANKLTGAQKLSQITEYLKEAYGEVCVLPTVGSVSGLKYKNVAIRPTSNIENAGVDSTGKVVRVISGEIRYDI